MICPTLKTNKPPNKINNYLILFPRGILPRGFLYPKPLLIKKYGFPIDEQNLLAEDYYEYDVLKPDLEAMKTAQLAAKPMPHGSSLDDVDMAKNAAIVKAKKEAAQTDADAELLREIRENSKKQNTTSSQREKREQEIMNQVDDEVDNWSEDDWKNYFQKQSPTEQKAYKILQILPEYQILVKNKAKMELAGKRIVNEFGSGAANGIDNLYHRRGMYEIGQKTKDGYIFSPMIGLVLGYLKEGGDFLKKYKKQSVSEILLDSFKDLGNNWDGLVSGIDSRNANKSSKEYYSEFDYKHNRHK